MIEITPISKFNGWWAKREDAACWVGLDFPSGAKVRQYEAMAKANPKKPMIVGCSSYSCMQVYVAAAAKRARVPGVIFVPERKEPTDATRYAERMGASLHYVPPPAWTSVLRKRAKDHAMQAWMGQCVRWSPDLALKDTMDQCANIPDKAKRIVVPTGSGLTVAGVLAGLAQRARQLKVLAVAVSDLASYDHILEMANKAQGLVQGALFAPRYDLELLRVKSDYGDAMAFKLPDGTPLDPYYAAKAMLHVTHGDCLWVPGLRPVSSMPPDIQQQYAQWKGFK